MEQNHILSKIEQLSDGDPQICKGARVVVAMSGGVDSSVVAAILHDMGYDVIGVTMQLYDHGSAIQKKGACCAGQDIYDAQMVCEKLGIKHYTLNYESVFKQSVIEDFADSYLQGQTPIPCIKCNQKVKFEDLFKFAKNVGAKFLATGHYVKRQNNDGIINMLMGEDNKKDQSYFLFTTTKEQLNYLRFPVGNLCKSETRELAKHYNLQISDKPDSQDICFVPSGSYKDVVRKIRPESAFLPGNIINTNGQIVGIHDGILNFTVGQRRGIGISGSDEPMYVIKILPKTNDVIIGPKAALSKKTFSITDTNYLRDDLEKKIRCTVKLRSLCTPLAATVNRLECGGANIELDEGYFGVAPGQACVMYQGEILIGGGWITST